MSAMFEPFKAMNMVADKFKDKPAPVAPIIAPTPVAPAIAAATPRSAAANAAETSQLQRDILGKAGRSKTILSAPGSGYG